MFSPLESCSTNCWWPPRDARGPRCVKRCRFGRRLVRPPDYTIKAVGLKEPASAIPIYARIAQSAEAAQFMDVSLRETSPPRMSSTPKTLLDCSRRSAPRHLSGRRLPGVILT